MKRYYIIYSLFGILGFTSCNGFLDEEPSTKTQRNEAIKTIRDMDNALNGVYALFVNEYSYAADLTMYGDVKGDDAFYPQNYNHLTPLSRYDNGPNTDHAEYFWRQQYTGIAYVNDILALTNSLSLESADDSITYSDLRGQLYALRGLLHFEIAKLYAQIPTIATNLDAANSGVVIADTVYSDDDKFSRSTLRQTYKFIINNFRLSLSMLTDNNHDGKINRWAAEALLARVYLYYGNNDSALYFANHVITNATNYRLYTISEYTTVWSKKYTVESLFEVTTTDVYNADRFAIGYQANPDGYGELGALDALVNFIQADPNDIRGALFTYYNDYTAYYTDKYPGQEGVTSPMYVNNPKVIRLSEVYLIAAEAAVKGGADVNAYSAEYYINQLRSNRIIGYTNVPSVNLDDVLAEARKELCFEGHRFFDLVRNNISFENQYVGEVSPTQYDVIVAIPQREIDISGADMLVQNPGYINAK
jgi:starch-binding outer membrane protein, SusD/RagB family